jgi:hypothetical protein
MRLLYRSDTGEFGLTEPFARDSTIPPYAILSHTWGADTEEVTFEDLTNGTGKDKPGYGKIRFCGEQAERDGLKYFWVDTCCINKSNPAELSHAINSMFCWYGNATRCYVFLSDVYGSSVGSSDKSNPQSWNPEFWSHRLFTWCWILLQGLLVARLIDFLFGKHKLLYDKGSQEALQAIHDESDLHSWDSEFSKSRWFTRGWTLQELLAPRSVEFFSHRHEQLGDKSSLRKQIHELTGIPVLALEGARLSEFSVDERFLWAERRRTKLPEDKVYSLLGIFDVQIPLYYGKEGAEDAHRRLREVIDKQEKCMQDLRISDPRDDKKRIENTKGGLWKDSYCWILGNSDFEQWRGAEQNALLWVKGDPGKGKTMLLCGIIDELDKAEAKTGLLSYFFCQATDARINNATAVLRGLIYMLVRQQPSLISHVRKKYDQAGKKIFDDANAWFALSEMFINILQNPSLAVTYIIIDALDECVEDLPKLLRLIVEQSATSSRVKWIISSRNWSQIEQQLEEAEDKTRLSLELNAESVSKAVDIYIEYKVLKLAQHQGYDDHTQAAILQHLSCNADGTFLWVALVCQNLKDVEPWDILETLKEFPPGLDLLYMRMLEQIRSSRSAGPCQKLLATMVSLYRPITLTELTSLVKIPNISNDVRLITRVIELCGSFLTIRNAVIYFVHQSAKDFLLKDAADKIFPCGQGAVHLTILTGSLHVLAHTLRRDIYDLRNLGCSIGQIGQPNPDPLTALRYACVYWVDHTCDWLSANHAKSQTGTDCWENIHAFIGEKYLYWLEALSLCGSISENVLSMGKLYSSLLHVIITLHTSKRLACTNMN